MGVIALMRCTGIDTWEAHYKNEKVVGGNVKLSAVCSDDPDKVEKTFCDATPNGSLELSINNPEALKQFTPGREYYIHIDEAKIGE